MRIANALRDEADQFSSLVLPEDAFPDTSARAPVPRDDRRELCGLARPRSWRDLERAMSHARDLRSRHCAALFAAGFRYLWKAVVVRRAFESARAKSVVCALMLASPVALAGFALPSRAAFAQEKIAVATRATGTDQAADQARLAELGISAGAVEQCEDAELLWRAVRELVLTQRVSEPMQQRILRRVWMLDPEILNGSRVDSDSQ